MTVTIKGTWPVIDQAAVPYYRQALLDFLATEWTPCYGVLCRMDKDTSCHCLLGAMAEVFRRMSGVGAWTLRWPDSMDSAAHWGVSEDSDDYTVANVPLHILTAFGLDHYSQARTRIVQPGKLVGIATFNDVYLAEAKDKRPHMMRRKAIAFFKDAFRRYPVGCDTIALATEPRPVTY